MLRSRRFANRRSRTCAARTVSILALLASAPVACASAGPEVDRREFTADELYVHGAGVDVQVLDAHYDEQHFTATVVLKNTAPSVITIERAGILLNEGDLEYPVTNLGVVTVPATIELAPGQARQLTLPFVTAHRLVVATTLRLRAIKQAGAWAPVVAIELPAAPEVAETDDAPR